MYAHVQCQVPKRSTISSILTKTTGFCPSIEVSITHLVRLEVELDVDGLVVLVHHLEGVGPVAIHVPTHTKVYIFFYRD